MRGIALKTEIQRGYCVILGQHDKHEAEKGKIKKPPARARKTYYLNGLQWSSYRSEVWSLESPPCLGFSGQNCPLI